MGKRHRKGKTRFANTKGIDDALDEQMIEADTADKRYGKQSYSDKQGVQSRNSIGGKIDRNQRRKGKNKKNVTKQRDIIQKGKLKWKILMKHWLLNYLILSRWILVLFKIFLNSLQVFVRHQLVYLNLQVVFLCALLLFVVPDQVFQFLRKK